jgi:Tol biopolymer transport system component/DNA-binding winged helix-turn-helix (wHTH) protein
MHETSEVPPRLITFGVFELDVRSGELWKSGTRLNLQQQPQQLLSVLLERPGELITRDELRKRLWPEDTFVDFEHGLNAAVKRLRDVLGDSADSPRFVETIPRRGYRFIAPTSVPRPAVVPADAEPARGRRWSRPWLLAGAIAAVALGLGLRALLAPIETTDGDTVSAPAPSGPVLRLTTGPHLDTEPAISPDGEWIAYASDRSGEGHLDIWMQRLTGGDPIRLTNDPSDDREPTFSADGSRIAFRSERDGGGILVMPAHSRGQATRLVGGGAHGPRFSPDGRWLAYSTGPGRFSTDKNSPAMGHTYLMPAAGGQSTRLLPDFVTATWPVWSPDGRHLLISAARKPSEIVEWWVTSMDGQAPVGTAVQVVTPSKRFPVRAWHWTEGNRIVYSAALGGDSWNLWEVAISPGTWKPASEPRRLTTGADLQGHAAIVRHRQQLIFASVNQTVNVWSLPLEPGSGRAAGPLDRLTATSAAQLWPAASHDGRRVVFFTEKPAPGALWMRDLETAREALLFAWKSPVVSALAADGSRVAFVDDTEGKRVIYAALTSGGVPEKLCVDCDPWHVQDWSKDGTRLLYVAGRPPAIFVLDLRSGTKQLVVRRPHFLWQARFSPDDRWISMLEAFHSEGRTRLWIAPYKNGAPPPDGDWLPITSGESWDDVPRWSTDGNLIYFTSLRDGFHCLWAQRLAPETKQPTGPAFPVHHLHSARLSINNMGFTSLGFTVSRNRLFINLGELSGNIWTTHLR